MKVPVIQTRIEKAHTFTGNRVDTVGFVRLMAITPTASESEVFRERFSTLGQRNDMFNFERSVACALWVMAIFATTPAWRGQSQELGTFQQQDSLLPFPW